MFCYQCGSELGERDYCPSCGADVKVFRQVVSASNRFYNDGLEKAGLHDLSGALTSLRQSIRLYKYNVDARNVLGLVYLELGETSAALSEWVISESIEKDRNPATRYLNDLNTNRNRLENLRQAIRKYNKALDYCHQEAYDLAEIQLKKVLQLNPGFLRARQLLSLLYLAGGDLGRAGRQLKKCRAQDPNNTTTLRYQKELSAQTLPEDQGRVRRSGELAEGVIQIKDGNETVIMPAGSMNTPVEFGGSRLPQTILNVGIGLLVGAAVVGFFVLPARVSMIRSAAAEQYRQVSEELDTRTAAASELQRKLEEAETKNTELTQQLSAYESSSGTLSSNDALFKAALLTMENPRDVDGIAAALEDVDYAALESDASEEYRALYEKVLSGVRTALVEKYYQAGYSAYTEGEYETAIRQLGFAVRYVTEDDSTYDDILYYYADANYLRFRGMESSEQSANTELLSEAQKYFNIVKDLEDSEYASDSETRLQEISLLKSQIAASAASASSAEETSDAAGTASSSDDGETASEGSSSASSSDAASSASSASSADNAESTQTAASVQQDAAAEAAAAQEAQRAAAIAQADAVVNTTAANLAVAQQSGDEATIAAAQAAYDAAVAQRNALN